MLSDADATVAIGQPHTGEMQSAIGADTARNQRHAVGGDEILIVEGIGELHHAAGGGEPLGDGAVIVDQPGDGGEKKTKARQ